MRTKILALVFALGSASSASAGKVVCADGTTSTSARGACSHHGGVAKRTERTRAKKHAHEQARDVAPRRRSRTHDTLTPHEQPDVQWSEPRHTSNPIEKREAGTPTAVCVDGELSFALNHRGACSGHGGVERWLDH